MKTLYTTPEITVEELVKADVLCASEMAQDNALGSYSSTGTTGGISSNSFDFDLGNLLV